MPLDNLGKVHFKDQQIQEINENLYSVFQILSDMAINLNSLERRRFAKVGEQNKLLINKVKQYHKSQPDLRSPEVDWVEFEKDYNDRYQASQMLAMVKSIETLLMNVKIAGDYDNYTDALKDYKYAKYKNSFANQTGYAGKIDALKGFFPKTGKTKKAKNGGK